MAEQGRRPLTVRRTTSEIIFLARSTLVAPYVYASTRKPIEHVTNRPPHTNAITSCQNAAPWPLLTTAAVTPASC